MARVVGVRFRNAGKIYTFDAGEFEISAGGHVVVETARGLEYGTVVGPLRVVDDEKLPQPLKPVVRAASPEDEQRLLTLRAKEREAMAICREKIRKHDLDMKLIDAEYTFDNSKILFYFTADGRVDFRELVKDLASVFRMRIELRQIGVRDETKILGGIGICGRTLCCHSYLTDFAPVSIKMAKEQNLSLNPTKISGVCGRLMCCLKNEEETYEYLNSQLPVVGETVTTKDGSVTGEVASVSVLRQKVKVIITIDDEKEIREFDAADLKFRPRRRKGKDEPSGKKGGKGRKGQDGREPWQSAAGEEMQDPEFMDEESWDDVPAESAEPEDEYAAVGESAGEAASGQDPEDEAREKNRRRNESRRNRRKRSERKEKEAGEAREGVSAQQQRERAGEDRETHGSEEPPLKESSEQRAKDGGERPERRPRRRRSSRRRGQQENSEQNGSQSNTAGGQNGNNQSGNTHTE